MDFGLLPPEINSALMYAGAGSGPMLAAAASWEGLAAELQSVASAYNTVVGNLMDGPWRGPSAASMATAAIPQIAWLSTTAELAREAGARAVEAVAAYEVAFAATVPPPEIAANRALLAALLATNFIGQNTGAIAAAEAQYAEMWAQDAGAMYGYSGASAQATSLAPFAPAPAATTVNGVGAQLSATAAATGAAASAQSVSAVPDALMTLAGLTDGVPWLQDPLAVLGVTETAWNVNGDGIVVAGALGDVLEAVTGSATLDAGSLIDGYAEMISPIRLFATTFQTMQGIGTNFGTMSQGAVDAAGAAARALPSALPSALPNIGQSISGAVGQAASVGGLKVPAAWAASTAPVNPVNVALSTVGGAAAAEPGASAFGGMPVMSGAGAARGVSNFAAPRYGFKPTMIVQPPSGG